MHTISALIIYSMCAIFVLLKAENKQKEAGFGPFKEIIMLLEKRKSELTHLVSDSVNYSLKTHLLTWLLTIILIAIVKANNKCFVLILYSVLMTSFDQNVLHLNTYLNKRNFATLILTVFNSYFSLFLFKKWPSSVSFFFIFVFSI